jgi:hypothetical protein
MVRKTVSQAVNIEKIGEPIRVLAAFSGGAVQPLRFKWHGRTYKVEAINGRWVDRQGETYSLHYSAQVGLETYYLHFSSKEIQWWLDEVVVT